MFKLSLIEIKWGLIFVSGILVVAGADSDRNSATRSVSQVVVVTNEVSSQNFSLTDSKIKNTFSGLTNQLDEVEDLLRWEAPIEIQKKFPYYLAGHDEEMRPIWVIEGGKWNVRSIVEEGEESRKNFEKYAIQAFIRGELAVNQSSTPELPVVNDILILDFDSLDLVQIAHVPTVRFLLHMARKVRHFPLKNMYLGLVVNTNSVAHTLINMVRPIFSRILERVQIFGTNRSKWIPHVLKHIPRSQIPEWYGGIKDFKPIQVYG